MFFFLGFCLHLLTYWNEEPHLLVLSFEFETTFAIVLQLVLDVCKMTTHSYQTKPKPPHSHMYIYISTENRPTITNADHLSVLVLSYFSYDFIHISLSVTSSSHAHVLKHNTLAYRAIDTLRLYYVQRLLRQWHWVDQC